MGPPTTAPPPPTRPPPQSRFVKGVGTAARMRVQTGQLAWMECAGVTFPAVEALFATSGGLDVSVYSAGNICGDLLGRVDVAFDYVNQRLWLRRPDGC